MTTRHIRVGPRPLLPLIAASVFELQIMKEDGLWPYPSIRSRTTKRSSQKERNDPAREKTKYDLDRIRAAELKRERKAKRK